MPVFRMQNTVEPIENTMPPWKLMDPWKPEVGPGAREETASPVWLAIQVRHVWDTANMYAYKRNI